MKTHAAFPDGKHFQRVAQVIRRLVEQAVAQTAAQDDAHHAIEQQVFNIAPHPGLLALQAVERWVLEAACTQPQKQAERG